ncbi:CvfB family protein [Virgibacillus sp. W0181]|uniref:CvfB family protein n=1 Tax=Virgibacillus sp. W0181 TaxID=3391581 RepID=UPI003F47886B
MDSIKIGTIQTMYVLRKIDTGYVLQKGAAEALLHHNETENELESTEEVDIFLYTDKNGQTIATTKLPSIQMDTYGWATVKDVLPHLGVFVDIGTTKDMLVSVDDLPLFQTVWPKPGDLLFVTLGKDRKGRLLAIPATESDFSHLWEAALEMKINTPISGRVYFTSKEGSAVITENNHRGFIHHTERKREPRLGELVNGRVIDVKEDGSINVSLLPLKHERMEDDAKQILTHLEAHNGIIPFTDKSDPEDIRATFQMSKSAFKRALGNLMKMKKVEQRDGNTYLIDKK